MSRKLLVTLTIFAFFAVSGVLYVQQKNTNILPESPIDKGGVNTATPGMNTAGMSPLVSLPYNFGIEYPSKYYVQAKELDASTTPHLVVIMILDTQENRDLLDGKSNVARDGGTGITINAYRNLSKLSVEDWAKQDTNWNVSNKTLVPTKVVGKDGVMFRWSGLYEGASVLLAHGDFVYVFAVSWETPQDPILDDFDQILASLRFN